MAKRARTGDFASWIESTIHLPLGRSAEPGQIKLPIYLREIAAAMNDPSVEKIMIQKSARIGFSTLLSSLIAYRFTEKPAPVFPRPRLKVACPIRRLAALTATPSSPAKA